MRPDVSPASPEDEQPSIGLIGMGAMGKMYASCLSKAGWKKIFVCDLPSKYEELKRAWQGVPGVTVLPNGHHVSRIADWLMYAVEAEYLDKIVAEYGPSTKVGAIVAGQTSVKAPEQAAFEKYLPEDVLVVSCHSLHGPSISPLGQPLVLIQHRAPDWALQLVENILRPFGSRYVYLSYEEHDRVTANVQAVTHAAFLSMGTAWSSSLSYPWEHGNYVGGVENVKVNIMLRIYANKWHVYAGLAILNPAAQVQIDQYARSATELYKLMLAGDAAALSARVRAAVDAVFGAGADARPPILLSEDVLDRFTLGRAPPADAAPNSHLSLLAMVDCWAALRIQPFVHLELAATPIFRMWLGVAEAVCRHPARLERALAAAVADVSHRADDLEFVVAARGWAQCVSFGSFELYHQRFETTAAFFQSRFEEANTLGSDMIQAIMESSPGKK